MQQKPVLEKLDCIFINGECTTSFPNTLTSPLCRVTSDHLPIMIQIDTHIPKGMVFRFEEFWPKFYGFYEIVEMYWSNCEYFANSAKDINNRFKYIRRGLKMEQKSITTEQSHRAMYLCIGYFLWT